LGLDPYRAVLLIHIVAVILGCLAIIGLNQSPFIANLLFGLTVLCGVGLLMFFEITLSKDSEQLENN
jgi:hypothetical protein